MAEPMMVYPITGNCRGGATTLGKAIVMGMHQQGLQALLVVPTEAAAQHHRRYSGLTGQVISAEGFVRTLPNPELGELAAVVLDDFDRMATSEGNPLSILTSMESRGRPVPRRVFTLVNR